MMRLNVAGLIRRGAEVLPVEFEDKTGRLIYACHLRPGSEPQPDYRYDVHQSGVCWKPLADLPALETVSFFAERLLVAIHRGIP